MDGSSSGSFTSSILGLSPNVTYYVRAYATNSVGVSYGNEISFTTSSNETGTVTDYDGNTYNTVKIGNQWWMAENLKVTYYPDGTEIQLVEANSAWDTLDYTDIAYCYYDNSSANGDTYGALYTWEAVMNGSVSSSSNPSGVQGVCPDDWHVPSDAEWAELVDYLGGESVAGGKLKEKGNTHWISHNNEATNESGFTALPGGYRYGTGNFVNIGKYGFWWSSTESSSGTAWGRLLGYYYRIIYRYYDYNEGGFSVRCVRD